MPGSLRLASESVNIEVKKAWVYCRLDWPRMNRTADLKPSSTLAGLTAITCTPGEEARVPTRKMNKVCARSTGQTVEKSKTDWFSAARVAKDRVASPCCTSRRSGLLGALHSTPKRTATAAYKAGCSSRSLTPTSVSSNPRRAHKALASRSHAMVQAERTRVTVERRAEGKANKA